MCKCVWDLKYVQIFYWPPMDPYNDPTWIPCGGAAGRPWIPIRILHGSYVGAQRAGSGLAVARWTRKMVLSHTAPICFT